jgi:hypothetical protein
MAVTEFGYLEEPYLTTPYLSGTVEDAGALQWQSVVTRENIRGVQWFGITEGDSTTGVQSKLEIEAQQERGSQWQSVVTKNTDRGLQWRSVVTMDAPRGAQWQYRRNDQDRQYGFEWRHSKDLALFGCGGYLEAAYLTEPYLVAEVCGTVGLQFLSRQTRDATRGFQWRSLVTKDQASGIQWRSQVTKDTSRAIAWEVVNAENYGVQWRVTIYNTSNLRILCDFPSRGTSSLGGNNAWGFPVGTGQNWQASSTAASSSNSFASRNLNTDIVEQVWRGNTNTEVLICDTELSQGVFLDTLAILNHSFTKGALVSLQGSNTSDFTSSNGPVISVPVELVNMYYIAPSLPLESYRYWRIAITDSANSKPLQIGTIVFGPSIILSDECFVDEVQFGQKHFVDKIFTEGHTNVSNDRGKKKYVKLTFKSLNFNRGNWQNLANVFEYAGVSLKCLYIPVPKQASRFSVFGKLAEIPEETHNYKTDENDLVSFGLTVDESL